MKHKTNEEISEKRTNIVFISFIVFYLDKLSVGIYHALANGWLGKLFTAYSKEQAAFKEGFLDHFFSSGTKIRFYVRWIKQQLSKRFETSFCLEKLRNYSSDFLATPLKSFGNFFLSFGIYTILIYFVRQLVPGLLASDAELLLIGFAVCILSIPMLVSRDNLAKTIEKGRITRSIFLDSFGFRSESFAVITKQTHAKANLMILLGMAFGLLTLFVSPLVILLVLALLVGLILIFVSPEIGVLLSIVALPFLSFFESPAMMLGMMVLLSGISYFIKLIRGKRIFRLEIMDLAVLLFMVVLFFSGTITAGGTEGYHEVLLSCVLMFGYFLIVNLMRTELWLKRCVLALVGSGTLVAVIGILQYWLGLLSAGAWIDQNYFPDIKGRAVSLFDNPNVLATYLMIVLPFALLLLVKSRNLREKAVCLFAVSTILLCTVFTWCRAAWIAALIILLIFALVFSQKTLRYLFLACFAIPFLPLILPNSVISRFMSIGDLADSSTMYRMYTWKGSWRVVLDNFWSGIGYGTSAFQEIYPRFAYAGIETAAHSHNLFLQILLGMGIGGLLIFLFVLLLTVQMNLEYMKTTKDVQAKWTVAAALCGIVGVLVMGLFDFVWYNYRLFFLFWAILAFSCAVVRVGNEEQRRHGFVSVNGESSAVIDIDLS